MNSNDQQFLDQLYGSIFVQQLRYNHFNAITPQPRSTSIWNKSKDERELLQKLVDTYKQYYYNKAKELQVKLTTLKESDITSYLTYNTEYYINQYNDRMSTIYKYITELETKTTDDILNTKMSLVSPDINTVFPSFMADSSLVGKFSKELEKPEEKMDEKED